MGNSLRGGNDISTIADENGSKTVFITLTTMKETIKRQDNMVIDLMEIVTEREESEKVLLRNYLFANKSYNEVKKISVENEKLYLKTTEEIKDLKKKLNDAIDNLDRKQKEVSKN